MTEQEATQQYLTALHQLKKLISKWDFLNNTDNHFAAELASQLLSHLYKNADSKKLANIISSELTTHYGLLSSDFDKEKLAEKVFNWW